LSLFKWFYPGASTLKQKSVGEFHDHSLIRGRMLKDNITN
jgi:hypothetical protein